MPLIAGSAPPPPSRPAKARKRFVWTAADGTELSLSDATAGYVSVPGRAGFGLPPREVVYDQLPGGGATIRGIRDQVRIISLPLRVQGADADEYLSRLRALQRAMRHPEDTDGIPVPGTLTVRLPDGSSRSISAYYHGGLDGEENPKDDLLISQQTFPRLEFIGLDPYWTGGTVTSPTWGTAAGVPWFGTLPLRLSPSQVLGSVTVDVPGDAESYPVWTITGPGVPTITNVTTGRSWAFKAGSPIADGRTVTVDTRPGLLTVTDDLGNNLYSSLESFPDFWPLRSGVNELTVEVADATSASSVKFVADVRWQTGW